MSGFCAVIRLDGAPPEADAVRTMAAAIPWRGPDGTAFAEAGSGAFAFLHLDATPDCGGALQPLTSTDGRVTILFDGWLANREDLVAALGSVPQTGPVVTDAELVLAAVRRWDSDAFARLDGDFAILAWDQAERRATMARDRTGLRPLTFRQDGARLIVCSDVAGIVALPDVPRRPDIDTLAGMASMEFFDESATFWQGIERVRRSHWLSIDAAGARKGERYWTPPLEVRFRYRDERQYVEEYAHLLTEAVRLCSRTHSPLACDVSGGQDSTALFAIADRLARSGRLQAPDLKGYTYVFEPGNPADEIAYARMAAQHVGRPVREIAPFRPNLDWFEQRVRDDMDMPLHANGAMAIAIGETMVADGCRVSLNGEGADEFFGGKSYYINELAKAGKFAALARMLAIDVRERGTAATLGNVVRSGIAPLAPLALRRRLRRRALRRRPYPDSFGPAARRGLDHARALEAAAYAGDIPNLARRGMFITLRDPFLARINDGINRQAGRIGYEVRSPFHNRKLLEFGFGMPEEMRGRGATIKYLHSMACEAWLPDPIAWRKDKPDFCDAFDRRLDHMESVFVRDLPGRHPEFFDADGMARQYDAYRRAGYWEKLRWPLWGMLIAGVLMDQADEVAA
ncbi:asparagine synthetase B family protein [Parablastomonas sp. CN1-191]|uniref:asparagine synthetase B family protein n=1 Tax=Parablastomonas sp. CN1-191 TaxID=3400908 RepID=UPI003BF803DF